MHAVLYLQANGPDAQYHQSLKKRLREARLGRLLAHHNRAQLAMVTHEDQLGATGSSVSRSIIYMQADIPPPPHGYTSPRML